jgi:UDP-N-acetylmuramoyl-L-alanyl-D-glutamate--2,6-diaminopimelate ligase
MTFSFGMGILCLGHLEPSIDFFYPRVVVFIPYRVLDHIMSPRPHFLAIDEPISFKNLLTILEGQVNTKVLSTSLSDNSGHAQSKFTALASSSSVCIPGALFCAHNGSVANGHQFISSALDAGASALLVEEKSEYNVPYIQVDSGRKSLSVLAAKIAQGSSYEQSRVVGITGTNGKTTTAHLIAQLIGLCGEQAASVGTLGVRNTRGESIFASDTTTPDPLYLHSILRHLRQQMVNNVALEVSSHALVQERVADVPFAVNIFTNLTQDHLDFHKTMESYRDAKFKLFLDYKSIPSLVCVDDVYGQQLAAVLTQRDQELIRYGFSTVADWRIENLKTELNSQSFCLCLPSGERLVVESAVLGRYNACNLVAALAACDYLGYPVQQLVSQCKKLGQAPGRLERFESGGVTVFVDYAHTPDALANVLKAARPICSRQLWVVFGCGGDRDRSKRPLMLAAARHFADIVVVTTDNPRTEEPDKIVADMLAGGEKVDYLELDRRQAIKLALSQAKPGDVILIAGKGHENYQIIGAEKHYFSDQAIVQDHFAVPF